MAGAGNGLKLSTPICATTAAVQRGVAALADTVWPFSVQRTVAPVGMVTAKTALCCPAANASIGSEPAGPPVMELSGPTGMVTGFPAGLLYLNTARSDPFAACATHWVVGARPQEARGATRYRSSESPGSAAPG